MKILSTLACATLAAAAGSASAVPTFTAGGTALAGEGLVTSVAGATTIDFNSGILPANYIDGALFTGTNSNHAAPPGDMSKYLSAGTSSDQYSPVIANFSSCLELGDHIPIRSLPYFKARRLLSTLLIPITSPPAP